MHKPLSVLSYFSKLHLKTDKGTVIRLKLWCKSIRKLQRMTDNLEMGSQQIKTNGRLETTGPGPPQLATFHRHKWWTQLSLKWCGQTGYHNKPYIRLHCTVSRPTKTDTPHVCNIPPPCMLAACFNIRSVGCMSGQPWRSYQGKTKLVIRLTWCW